jgi:hypothetical protein
MTNGITPHAAPTLANSVGAKSPPPPWLPPARPRPAALVVLVRSVVRCLADRRLPQSSTAPRYRHGDGHANWALHIIITSRLRWHPASQAHTARRGTNKKDDPLPQETRLARSPPRHHLQSSHHNLNRPPRRLTSKGIFDSMTRRASSRSRCLPSRAFGTQRESRTEHRDRTTLVHAHEPHRSAWPYCLGPCR